MDDLTRQFLVLVRKIQSDIHEAVKELALIHQASDSGYEQPSAAHDSDSPEKESDVLTAIKAIQDANDSAEAKKYALDHRRYRLEWKGYRVSRLTAIFLFFYTTLTAIIAIYSIRSANAAKSAADTSQKVMRLDHRASIVVKISGPIARSFPLGQPIIIPLDVSNIGKTTAKNLDGTADTYFLSLTDDLAKSPEGWQGKIAYGALFPGDSRLVPSEILNKDKTPVLLTGAIAKQVNEGNLIVLTFGRINYEDSFGKRWTQFCFLTGPLPTRGFTTKEKTCNAYNKTDEEQ